MEYQQALESLRHLATFGINLGLQRIEDLLHRLGDPHKQGMRIIHIAGTNGKGSVCTMLQSIIVAERQSVGLFTSPHLHSYRERFRINGQPASKEALADALTRVIAEAEAMRQEGFEPPTEFEVNTAMALLLFAAARVKWVILEAGMGGSIDSTNAADGEIAIITNVAMDHMDYLGDTLEKIAQVKSGIIKKGARVFTAAHEPALTVIKQAAAAADAGLASYGSDFEVQVKADLGQDGWLIKALTPYGTIDDITLSLLGEHQLTNAALAIAAAKAVGISDNAVRQGVRLAVWPGRLEVLSQQPLVVLDGAHNDDGMASLAAAIKRYWPDKRLLALMGILADKEREKAMLNLLPLIDELIITPPPVTARTGNWRQLAVFAKNYGLQKVSERQDLSKAIDLALHKTTDDDLLLVCGSLYLVADARAILLKRLKGVTVDD